MFGGSFLIGLALAIAAYVTVYYRALKYRRKVWIHSGYMLTTPLILFESPFSRLLNVFMPGLAISGPDDLHLIMPSILWAMAIELAIIAAIWLKYREKANPFLVAAGFIAAQMLTMGLMAESALLKSLLVAIGQVPSAAVVLAGFAIGALTSWAGWQAGKRPACRSRRPRSRPEAGFEARSALTALFSPARRTRPGDRGSDRIGAAARAICPISSYGGKRLRRHWRMDGKRARRMRSSHARSSSMRTPEVCDAKQFVARPDRATVRKDVVDPPCRSRHAARG